MKSLQAEFVSDPVDGAFGGRPEQPDWKTGP
jgi:hypothetical protein